MKESPVATGGTHADVASGAERTPLEAGTAHLARPAGAEHTPSARAAARTPLAGGAERTTRSLGTKRAPIAIVGAAVLLAALPLLGLPAFYDSLLYLMLHWIVLATSWNILSGYTGYFSFGHGAFFGAGLYTTSTLLARYDWPFLWTLPVAALVAAALGVALGAVVFRVKGVRGELFALLTLAVTFVIGTIVGNTPLDGGQGVSLASVAVPKIGPTASSTFYLLALVAATATLLIAWGITVSRFGAGLFAIHDDEDAAEVMGVPTYGYKLVALAISCALAGVAGGIHALFLSYVTVGEVFTIAVPLTVVLMSVLGGTRHWAGPAVGAIAITALLYSFTAADHAVAGKAVTGAILIAAILFMPDGILPRLQRWARRGSAPASVATAAARAREGHGPGATGASPARPAASAAPERDMAPGDAGRGALTAEIGTAKEMAAAKRLHGWREAATPGALGDATPSDAAPDAAPAGAVSAPTAVDVITDATAAIAGASSAGAGTAATRAGEPLLQVRRLSKRFKGVRALHEVDVEVRRGEILGLLGPNGSGKSTFINVVSGHYATSGGEIRFEGRDLTHAPAHRIAAAGIARTYQIPRPFAHLTVLQNVAVATMFGGAVKRPEDAHQQAMAWLEFTGLEARADALPDALNLHQRKFLELARALASRPRLVLLDEVLCGLTPSEIDDAVALIRRIRDQGSTIVFVEHVMRAVMALTDRIVVFDHGELLAEGTASEVMQRPEVRTAYLGTATLAGAPA